MAIVENEPDAGGTAITGNATGEKAVGVRGISVNGVGVYGESNLGWGVRGHSDNDLGVHGTSMAGQGVWGRSETGIGVQGTSPAGQGVWGRSETGTAVYSDSTSGTGVYGSSQTGVGVHGDSNTGEGIRGGTNSPTVAAIAAFNRNPAGTGAAIYAQKDGNSGHAGFFVGNVHVTGNLVTEGDITLQNADCAEDFDIADADLVEPGTVMVLGEEGVLKPSDRAYDKRVAGVVSGAGGYRPGIVLDKQPVQGNRSPIALLGKVFCKVDAGPAPVEVGDLLTTSDTPGHAMKAGDSTKAFGSVIGKALRPLPEGQGLIPILIALQ